MSIDNDPLLPKAGSLFIPFDGGVVYLSNIVNMKEFTGNSEDDCSISFVLGDGSIIKFWGKSSIFKNLQKDFELIKKVFVERIDN